MSSPSETRHPARDTGESEVLTSSNQSENSPSESSRVASFLTISSDIFILSASGLIYGVGSGVGCGVGAAVGTGVASGAGWLLPQAARLTHSNTINNT